jgi:hypothetical protein
VTCSEFLAQLDDLIDNDVTAALRVDLEEHLRDCDHCLVTLNTTRKTIEIYRSHEIYPLPNELRDRLQKAILAKCKKC